MAVPLTRITHKHLVPLLGLARHLVLRSPACPTRNRRPEQRDNRKGVPQMSHAQGERGTLPPTRQVRGRWPTRRFSGRWTRPEEAQPYAARLDL